MKICTLIGVGTLEPYCGQSVFALPKLCFAFLQLTQPNLPCLEHPTTTPEVTMKRTDWESVPWKSIEIP